MQLPWEYGILRSLMNDQPLQITLEFTPNPNTLKYSINRTLMERGTANFISVDQAQNGSELAVRLFNSGGISGVMLGRDFITITKSPDGDWDQVHEGANRIIEEFLEAGLPLLKEEWGGKAASGALSGSSDSDAEKRIRDIIDREIRPAVAMDGGDITFEKYDSGVVYVFLQGSCAGCPSSTMTLKMGIENRLKEVVPEVREVVSV